MDPEFCNLLISLTGSSRFSADYLRWLFMYVFFIFFKWILPQHGAWTSSRLHGQQEWYPPPSEPARYPYSTHFNVIFSVVPLLQGDPPPFPEVPWHHKSDYGFLLLVLHQCGDRTQLKKQKFTNLTWCTHLSGDFPLASALFFFFFLPGSLGSPVQAQCSGEPGSWAVSTWTWI